MRLTGSRGAGPLLAILLLAGSLSCNQSDVLFPPNGSLRLQVLDSGLVLQSSSQPGFQVTAWLIESATAEVEGLGSFDFLQGKAPCAYVDNVLLLDDLIRNCGGSGLVLATGPGSATVHLLVSSMEARRVIQPVLLPDVDDDGDGLVNRYDNCPLIRNPAQEDSDGNGVGDACSVSDPVAGVLPDSDGDGFPDVLDNCRYVPNADQADAARGADLIGDACEQFTSVELPEGQLSLSFPAQFSVNSSGIAVLIVDFNDRTALSCDPALTRCRIDPTAVQFSVRGG